jgi:DNA integrity scanning protein DisA with diadenylate cyclase activity
MQATDGMQSIGVTWQGVADFIAVCVVLYFLLRFARLIRALRIAALLGVGYGAAVVAWHLNLAVTARVLEDCVVALMGIIVVVFQPEIRRALLKADAFSLFG